MKPPRILILEDEPDLLDFLAGIFEARGFSVVRTGTCAQALFAVENEPFNCALLDLLLPDGNGFEILRTIRRERGNVPIIVQTALGEDEFCVRCLKAGADDFVVKPVRPGPLIARIQAVMRRTAGESVRETKIPLRGGVVFDANRFRLEFPGGRNITLTRGETRLLQLLAERRDEFVSADAIILKIWECRPSSVNPGRLTTQISRLRRKLENAAEIESRYGGGYVLRI